MIPTLLPHTFYVPTSNLPPRTISIDTIPMVNAGLKTLKLINLPMQDNHYDCGLFMLTSVEVR